MSREILVKCVCVADNGAAGFDENKVAAIAQSLRHLSFDSGEYHPISVQLQFSDSVKVNNPGTPGELPHSESSFSIRDGRHRLAAAKSLNWNYIRARVFDGHGSPLTY